MNRAQVLGVLALAGIAWLAHALLRLAEELEREWLEEEHRYR